MKINDLSTNFKIVATFLGSLITILGAIWFFGKPFLDDYINEKMDAYIVSPSFTMFVDKTISEHEQEVAEKDSKKVGLRKLLSDKMGVAEDEVHIELGRMFKNERLFQEAIIKNQKEIKEEIKYYHPNTILKP